MTMLKHDARFHQACSCTELLGQPPHSSMVMITSQAMESRADHVRST